MELDQAIIKTLTDKPGLETQVLAVEAGKHMGLHPSLTSTRSHKDRVYRKAVQLRNAGKLTCRKAKAGKKHESHWTTV